MVHPLSSKMPHRRSSLIMLFDGPTMHEGEGMAAVGGDDVDIVSGAVCGIHINLLPGGQ